MTSDNEAEHLFSGRSERNSANNQFGKLAGNNVVETEKFIQELETQLELLQEENKELWEGNKNKDKELRKKNQQIDELEQQIVEE